MDTLVAWLNLVLEVLVCRIFRGVCWLSLPRKIQSSGGGGVTSLLQRMTWARLSQTERLLRRVKTGEEEVTRELETEMTAVNL